MRYLANDVKVDSLTVYSSLNENQIKHIYEPDEGLFIAESPKVIERAMDAGYVPESFLVEEDLLNKSEAILSRFPDVDVYVTPHDALAKLTGYPMTRGLLAAMRRRRLLDYGELIRDASRVAVLDGVTNPTNVGAIFRSAAAMGLDALILSPDCCDPLYRRALRVSMGTVFQIPWTVMDGENWLDMLFDVLKSNGFVTVATALSEDAVPLQEMTGRWGDKTAIVMGAEGDGLSELALSKCDVSVTIPMASGVDSLNVAAASAVIFWEMMRK